MARHTETVAEIHDRLLHHLRSELLTMAWELGIETARYTLPDIAGMVLARLGVRDTEDATDGNEQA